jgi:transposase
MTQQELFAAALGLVAPWKVVKIEFSAAEKRLDIHIDFDPGSLFLCPNCQSLGKAYDTTEDCWRHLNFFQHATFLHARVPRCDCKSCNTIRKVDVPWARAGSGFTLLFEAFVMALGQEMPISAVADLIGEHDTRVWRVLRHYVRQAVKARRLDDVTTVGVDETASRRGHRYVTLFFDLDKKRLIYATSGKDADTVNRFVCHLKEQGGTPHQIRRVACDMSGAFIKGVQRHLPNAEITFDRFHLTKIVNDAVDQVRREEASANEILKKTRFIWLTNPKNLSKSQRRKLFSLSFRNLKTVRAYNIRLAFQEFFSKPDLASGEKFLKQWYFWATHSRLAPIIRAAKTVKNHGEGVLNWFSSRITTGLVEGCNSLKNDGFAHQNISTVD